VVRGRSQGCCQSGPEGTPSFAAKDAAEMEISQWRMMEKMVTNVSVKFGDNRFHINKALGNFRKKI